MNDLPKAAASFDRITRLTAKSLSTLVQSFKTILAGFDELNRLAKPVEQKAAAKTSSAPKTAAPKEPKPEKTPEPPEDSGLDWAALLAALENVTVALDSVTVALDGVAAALDAWASALGGWISALTAALAPLPGLLETLSGLLTGLLPALLDKQPGRDAQKQPAAPAPANSPSSIVNCQLSIAIPDSFERFIEYLRGTARAALDAAASAFSAAADMLSRLWDALKPFSDTVGAGLAWLYENVLTPLGNFVIGELLPRFLQGLAAALGVVNAVIEAARPAFLYLFDNFLKPVAAWTCGAALGALDALGAAFGAVCGWIADGAGLVGGALEGIARVVCDQAAVLLEFADCVMGVLRGVVDFVAGVFTGDWGKAWNGVTSVFKNVWNGMVTLMYGAVNLIIRGVNGMVASLNKVSFSVPSWVPGIGGNSFGFNIPRIAEVAVPKLAQGAVIPANREFLAVLGDQSAGRNLEAPESLIRQIVREEGGNSRVEALLERLVDIARQGQVVAVDETVLGRVAARAQNAEIRRLGFTPLMV